MAFDVEFSPTAAAELEEIELYLAERFYPGNAARFVTRIAEACQALSKTPYSGTKRDDIRPGIRLVGFERKVTILFTIDGERVIILRIAYGRRNIDQST